MKSISLYLSSSTQDKNTVFSVFTSFQIFKFLKKGVFYTCLLNVDLHKHYLLGWAQFSFEQQQNIPPQKDIQNIPPQNMPLLCIYYFETQHLKNSKCRKRFSLNSSCLPENSCQKELNCHKCPPQEFHPQGTLQTCSIEETIGQQHMQTYFIINYHTSYLFS